MVGMQSFEDTLLFEAIIFKPFFDLHDCTFIYDIRTVPVDIYFFNNGTTRIRCEIFSKLIDTSETCN